MVPLWIGYASLKISVTWNDKNSLLFFCKSFLLSIYSPIYLYQSCTCVSWSCMMGAWLSLASLSHQVWKVCLCVCVCVCMVRWRWSRCQMVSWPSVVSGLSGSQLLSMTLRSSVGFWLDLRTDTHTGLEFEPTDACC